MKLVDITKQYKKDNLLYSGDDLKSIQNPRIPSGVFVFDLLTGGGIPEGKFTGFYGSKGSGKTTFSLIMAQQFLNKYKDRSVAFINFEHTYNSEWAGNFIKDTSRFYLVEPDYAEHGIDIIKDLAQADDIGLIIIDSLAMMISVAEASADANQEFMGLQAKAVNKLFRKLLPIVSIRRRTGSYLTILLINQTRANFQTRAFQPQIIKPGGMMQDFVLSLDIRFYLKEYKKMAAIPIQAIHSFTIEKNKYGLPKRSGEFTLNLIDTEMFKAGSIDENEVVFNYARRCGLILKDTAKWCVDGKSFKTLTEAEAFIKSDSKFLRELKNKTLAKCLSDIMLTGENKEE